MRVGEAALAELVAMCRVISVFLLPAAVAIPNDGCDVRVSARSRIPRVFGRVAAYLALAGRACEPGPFCCDFPSDIGLCGS